MKLALSHQVRDTATGLLWLAVFFVVVAGLGSLVTGCASQQAALVGYERAGLVAVRAVEDNNIALWTINACGTPYSAAIRNPQIIAALKALCLPEGQQNAPVSLLDAVIQSKPLATAPSAAGPVLATPASAGSDSAKTPPGTVIQIAPKS